MHPLRLLLVLAVAGALSCSDGQEGGPGSEMRADPPASDAAPVAAPDPRPEASEPDAVARWGARLPHEVLVRRGACPFECCVYGEWVAESSIPLLSEPRLRGQEAVAQLEPGRSFQADSGFVRVTRAALVAVTAVVSAGPERTLAPGDTLLLLDYVGEGFYNAWLNGEVVELSDFWSSTRGDAAGELIGEHRTEWWVHATLRQGENGWFRADGPGVEIGGADACGGPP
jgi:hypothetical protein